MANEKIRRTLGYLGVSYLSKACNQELEDSIALKFKRLCKKYGELQYEIIEHKVEKNYKDLSILEKKLLMEEINNTIILHTYDKNMICIPMVNKEHANSMLKAYDNSFRSRLEIDKPNLLLSDNVIWVKFNNGDTYLNLEKACKNQIFTEFLHTKIIRHALINNYKLPLINMEDTDKYERDIANIYRAFTKEELNYVN